MGDRHERMLVNTVEDDGWGAVRLGGSGSGTKRNLPDILAGDGGTRYWGIEEKYSGANKQCYESGEKHAGLTEFCTRFGLKPLYAVRYSTDLDGVGHADWRIGPADIPDRTSSGRVKLHYTEVQNWPLLKRDLLDLSD